MQNGILKDLTERIIGAAIEAHRELGGPGLLEKVYETAFCRELKNAGLEFSRQCECPIIYKGENIGDPEYPLRIDVLVENCIVVECKAVAQNNPIFSAQCLTYLRLKNLPLGLVINFGFPKLVQGVDRVLNSRYRPDDPKLRSSNLCCSASLRLKDEYTYDAANAEEKRNGEALNRIVEVASGSTPHALSASVIDSIAKTGGS